MLKHFKDAPHTTKALSYAYDAINGHRDACKEEKQACQRFIDDFNSEFEFFYDVDKAERACRFIEQMPHTKGKWAAQKKKLILEPWQAFIVCNLFGWVNESGLRRYRKAYLKIPRKNGKSLLVAAIGHLMFSHDGEFGAEVYCGATTEKQAWEVFGPARLMALKTADYISAKGIEVNAKNLSILENGSKFEPLIGTPGDGSSPSCAIADEYHEHDKDDFVETMETGMGAREQPLLIEITTAGSSMSSPCYDMEEECKKMLDGVFVDDQLFVLIFGIDEGDDWTKPEMLKKANPNFDISVSGDFLLTKQKEAVRNASKQNIFQRKHLNKWVGAKTAWLNMETFKKCADTSLDINDFIGRDCIIPVDLASRLDITATPILFYEEIDGKKHYTLFSKFYIPEETALDEKNNHYQKWVIDGFMAATEGNEIDFNEIQADLKGSMKRFNAREVAFDPWRATQLAQGLQNEGAEIVEFRNTDANMSPAMYELEAAIEGGRFHYDGNPVLTWMASNVIARVNSKDIMHPCKHKKENKIDGIVALIMGIGRAMSEEQKDDINDFINNPIII